MKHIIAVLIGLILFGTLSGCATVEPTIFTPKNAFDFYFNISSVPDDAEVYINDRLFGRTPCKFPLTVSFITQPGLGFTYYPRENYVLRVSKDGYRDNITQIIFYSDSCNGPSLKPGEPAKEGTYNFNLEKK